LVDAAERVDADTLAALLGMSAQAVREAEHTGRLFSLEVEGERYFPRFYADESLQWAWLEVVFRLITPRWAAFQFLRSRKGSLGGATPLEALREGRLDAVCSAAMAYMEL
jgi:hypothetical protein